MTRKHYKAIADVMYESAPLHGCVVDDCHCASRWRETIDEIADVMAADNPRFNRAMFLTACGAKP